MGVVHKLKREVVDFIIEEKKRNHSLSCRQIAAITAGKFNIRLSKSSVNAVIKGADLSSAVGRRVFSEAPPKKFQIPLCRKKQILEDMQKVKFDPTAKARPSSALPQKETGKPLSPEKKKKPCPSGGGVEEEVSDRKELACDHVALVQRTKPEGAGQEGMGLVFLKAAEWELSNKPILSGLLRKYVKERLPVYFDQACAILPYLSLLGVRNKEDAQHLENHAVWTLNNQRFQPQALDLLDWAREAVPSLGLCMEYDNFLQQVFSRVSQFKLFVEDGTEFCIDAQMASVWREKAPEGLFAGMPQAVSLLSHCVISNNDPAVFFCSGAEVLTREAVMMVKAFEGGKGEEIKKATVLNHQGVPIAEFSMIPRQKRFFIVGAWPWQNGFHKFMEGDSKNLPGAFYCEALDKIVHYQEIKTDKFLKDMQVFEKIRVIAILDQTSREKQFCVLTNNLGECPENILKAFVLRWPNLGEGYVSGILNGTNISQLIVNGGVRELKDGAEAWQEWESFQKRNVQDIVQDFSEKVLEHCQRRFFTQGYPDDKKPLMSVLYGVSGHLIEEDKVSLFDLRLPSGYAYYGKLNKAVRKINESAITDFSGNRLFIKIRV